MCHHTNERDLIYCGLNVKMVKEYLSAKKNESTTADCHTFQASFSDIKKYYDAIKWGALRADRGSGGKKDIFQIVPK